jgi:arabinose-5-phosphate isomerase
MITSDDVLLILSHSGESDEVVNLAKMASRNHTVVVAMVGILKSTLAKVASIVLHCHIDREACPLGVAPTASTIVQMAMGDALTIATMKSRGFTREDFGRTHPFGSLGRKLHLRVYDVMQPLEKIPHMPGKTPLIQAITEMATSRIGAVVILHEDSLAGIFTDADLRRLLVTAKDKLDTLSELTLEQVANCSPLTIDMHELASQALLVFEKRHVSRIICTEDGKAKGLISLFDLLDKKVVL